MVGGEVLGGSKWQRRVDVDVPASYRLRRMPAHRVHAPPCMPSLAALLMPSDIGGHKGAGLDSGARGVDDHLSVMEIDRNQIVEMFVMRGDLARAEQAERDLPARVDPLAYRDALGRLGIDPALLMTLSDGLEH